MISVIIPVYNEEAFIEKTLFQLMQLKHEADIEIIVNDGNSTDKTVEIASTYAKIIQSSKGKGKQLNEGAKHAEGNILFFVHADMYVPEGALKKITKEIYENGFDGGGFSNLFKEHNKKIKLLGRILHLRLNHEGQSERKIFYGDNGIFVKKEVFQKMGGFKEISIMEDYDFSTRLLAKYKVCLIKEPKLVVDTRRHIKDGFLRTRLKWMLIKRLYLMGVSPQKLADWYKDIR